MNSLSDRLNRGSCIVQIQNSYIYIYIQLNVVIKEFILSILHLSSQNEERNVQSYCLLSLFDNEETLVGGSQ